MEPVCKELDIRFTANKGYSSSSALYKIGGDISDLISDGKRVAILYFGDHDPSGIDMTRDVEDRLRLLSGEGDWDSDEGRVIAHDEDPDTTNLLIKRVALNMDQVRQYNPPPNPAKLSDSRADGYIREYGRESWELDALEPRVLEGLVREFADEYCDEETMDAAKERQAEGRTLLREIADRLERGESLWTGESEDED